MLVYIEHLSRLPGVSVQQFHFALGRLTADAWTEQHAEDQLVLNLGRTFRIGPSPSYLMAWYSPNSGLERLTAWDSIFKSGESDHVEETARLAARLEVAGCYEPLIEPIRGERGPFYAERFEFAEGVSRADVTAFYEERRVRHDNLELHLLVDRIGKLGPDPRGFAVWRGDGFGSFESVARELDDVHTPIELLSGAFYENTGEEEI